jgi:carboxyl-terminal processing protease
MTKKQIAFLSLSVVLMLTLVAGALFGQATTRGSVYRHLSIFSEVFELVRSNYVEQVASESLMDGAFAGVTDAIDEFSYYVPPIEMPAHASFTDVDDNGVGLVVTKRFGYAYVVSAIDGSPGAVAGIERGDFIEMINGKATTKMPVWQIRNALRSSAPVKLQVLHGGETKRSQITLKPGQFHPVKLESSMISGVAYVKIPYFEKGTAAELRTALEAARKNGVRKLIIDVRGNAGGSVDEAITAADELLTSGVITGLEGRKVEPKKWQADRDTSYDGEVQVLADMSTAAGGEIFAAAIRGNNRGKFVGVTTYGKAIVQKFITLPSGGGVQMTVGHYTTPDLKAISETGVKPDVVVDLSAQAIEDPDADKNAKAEKEDLILHKALQLYGVTLPAKEAKKAA